VLVILNKVTLKLQKGTKNIGSNLNTKNIKKIVINSYTGSSPVLTTKVMPVEVVKNGLKQNCE
jgi:hypothetical protein